MAVQISLCLISLRSLHKFFLYAYLNHLCFSAPSYPIGKLDLCLGPTESRYPNESLGSTKLLINGMQLLACRHSGVKFSGSWDPTPSTRLAWAPTPRMQAVTRTATAPFIRTLRLRSDYPSCNVVVEMFDCYVFLTVWNECKTNDNVVRNC